MNHNDDEELAAAHPRFEEAVAQVLDPILTTNPSIVAVNDFGIAESNRQLDIARVIGRGGNSNYDIPQVPRPENSVPLQGTINRSNLMDDTENPTLNFAPLPPPPSEATNQRNNASQSPESFMRRLEQERRNLDPDNSQSRR